MSNLPECADCGDRIFSGKPAFTSQPVNNCVYHLCTDCYEEE